MDAESPVKRIITGFDLANTPRTGHTRQMSPLPRAPSRLTIALSRSPASGSYKTESEAFDEEEAYDGYWEEQDAASPSNSIDIPLRDEEYYKLMLRARVAANARLWHGAQQH